MAYEILCIPPPLLCTDDYDAYKLHSTEANQRHSREARSLQACGWTTSLSLLCPQTPSHQPQVLYSIDRKTSHGLLFLVLKLYISYNSNMGGVDQGDQLCGYYNCRTKSQKFYKHTFYFLFDVSITNAFILWKRFSSAAGMTLKEFRLQLAQQLIGDYCSHRRTGRGSGSICPLPLQHFPLKVQDDTSGANKRGHCACCLQVRHKRTDTSWFVESVMCGCVIVGYHKLTASSCGTKTEEDKKSN